MPFERFLLLLQLLSEQLLLLDLLWSWTSKRLLMMRRNPVHLSIIANEDNLSRNCSMRPGS